VKLATVTQEEVASTRSVLGVFAFDRTSRISTEVAGLVASIAVNQGDRVKTGDELVRLNTEILEQEIALQRSRIEQVELRIANTEKNYRRLESLFNQSGVSEKEYDDALYTFDDARKEREALKNSLQKLLIQQKRSRIAAPFDGLVLSKDVDVGSWVQPGAAILTLGALDDLVIKVPVAETTLRYLDMGQPIPVTLTAFGTEVTGTLLDIEPIADIKTKNVSAKIAIEPPPIIAENMSATVTIPSSDKKTLSILSRAALIKFQGEDFIYTVEDGMAKILPVNVVAYLGERIGVDNPYIVPGMQVVVEGNERVATRPAGGGGGRIAWISSAMRWISRSPLPLPLFCWLPSGLSACRASPSNSPPMWKPRR
jgi:membrane fusion protein (multidrug efflux system)